MVQQEHIEIKPPDGESDLPDKLIFHGNKLVGYENYSGKLPISGNWGNVCSELGAVKIIQSGNGKMVVAKETKRYEVLINLGIPKCYTGEYDEHIANKDIKFPFCGTALNIQSVNFNIQFL